MLVNSTELLEEEVTVVKEGAIKTLVLYNDDVNTFDHVINCLIKYCKHEVEQADQCAHIVHFKGKCAIKSGSFNSLRPICEALLENKLSAKIEN
ncbi:MAG: ATP-dependent Clp protease adaptor ClpS [Bacteroidetes bacterium]|nr:ATP-dependent Clp protease adaptor ClpS [Bacteroidota bacterium]